MNLRTLQLIVFAALPTWLLFPSVLLAQGGVLTQPPVLLEAEAAAYPEEALEVSLEGHVDFALTILETGEVTDVEVIGASDPVFVVPAERAVSSFRFSPAEIDGEPAAIRIEYRYTFVLEDVMVAVTTATLDGCVVDAEGNPRPGIRVAGHERFDVETDEDGCFRVEGLEPGLVEIVFQHPDFPMMAVTEELDAGMILTTLYELDEFEVEDAFADDDDDEDDFVLVIRAPSVRREALAVEVRSEEARRMAGTQGDVLRVVEQMAGVGRSAAGSGALVVWGASPEDTRVYVDGVRLPRLYHTGGYRTVLPGAFVRSVALLPGAYAAPYGRGLGGLILVEMDDPFATATSTRGEVVLDAFDASASMEVGLHEDVRLSFSVRQGHLDRLVEGGAGLGVFPEDSPILIPRYTDLAARLVVRPVPADRLELRAIVSLDDASRRVEDPDPSLVIREGREVAFWRVSGHWSSVLADGTRLTLVPAIGQDRRNERESLGGVGASIEVETTLVSLRGGIRQEVGDHTLEAGLDLEFEQADIRRVGSIGAPAREGDARVFGQPPPDQRAADRWQASQVGAAPYLLTLLRTPERHWELELGLRVDPYYRSASRRLPQEGAAPQIGIARQDLAVEPRASLLYRLHEHADLRLSAGQFRQFPQFEDSSAVFGTPGLRAARGRHVVLASRVQPARFWTLESALFTRFADRLAVRSGLEAPPRAEALVASGEGRSRGVQTVSRFDFDALQLQGTYTFSRSERRSSPAASWRLFDQDQPHVANVSLGWRLPDNWYLSSRYRFSSGFPRSGVTGAYFDGQRDAWQPVFQGVNDTRLPSTHGVDARVEKTWVTRSGAWSAWLDVQNVLNRANPEEFLYSADFTERTEIPGLPFLPSVGVRYVWGQ